MLGQTFTLWKLLISAAVTLAIAAWVFVDARKRGKSCVQATVWSLFTFLFCIGGWPLWLLTRPELKEDLLLSQELALNHIPPGAANNCSRCTHLQRTAGLFDERFQCGLSGVRIGNAQLTVCQTFSAGR